MRFAILGDSQADGLDRPLATIVRRHGYELDENHSYVRSGASLSELIERAPMVGPVDLVLVASGGGNDPASLVNDQNAYRSKLATLVDTLRAGGARNVLLLGPLWSDDASVQAQHEAARLVQGRGIPGARWIDGVPISIGTPHPVGNLTHWTASSYDRIALELEKSMFLQGEATAIGLVGTLTFLAAGGVVVMELLYARAAGDVG